ncbi:MAG: protein-L-isoaspartate O-methyltransferase [Rhodoferax sp.]
MNIEQARFNMIEQQIRPWNVLDASVLELLAHCKREDFVPAAHRALAFADMELPLQADPQAVAEGRCMLAPKVEARMLQDLALRPTDSVLEIGTGSGYMAALLASQAGKVLSLEIVPELAQQARENLRKAGVTKVEVREADGARFQQTGDPCYDAIVLSGSVAEIPHALLAMLKIGGRLSAIVGDEPVMRGTLVTRTSDTDYRVVQGWDFCAARLAHFTEPSRFKF